MATSQTSKVIHQLRRAMTPSDESEPTDRQLLMDYVERRDEAALTTLVRRHAAMVWGVCRRVLRNHHDAEDAFQATFLVLVRKAASIASPELLANWLYGVAHQTALKARATSAKRGTREKQVTEMPETAATEQNLLDDLHPLLDRELSRLPDKYRVAIVLCELEGKTRKEAARQLGVPEGTLAGRLTRGRVMLAKRLSQHGLTISGGVLTTLLSQGVASSSMPNALVCTTVKAASLFAAGRAAGVVSEKVAALTEGVLKNMFLTNLKSATVVLLLAVVAAVGAGLIGLPVQAAQPPQPPSGIPKPGDPVKMPIGPGIKQVELKPLVIRESAQVEQVAWNSDSNVVAAMTTAYEIVEVTDGDGKNPVKLLSSRRSLKLWNTTTGKLTKSLDEEKNHHIYAIAVSPAPDKKLVAIMGSKEAEGGKDKREGSRHFVRILDAETWAVKQELDHDDLNGVGHIIVFSPDGKTLAVGGGSPLAEDHRSVLKLWDIEGKKMLTSTKLAAQPQVQTIPEEKSQEYWDVTCFSFSPDGKILAAAECKRIVPGIGKVLENEQRKSLVRIQLYDAKTGEPKRGWEIGEGKGMVDVAFTADGKSLVSACGSVKVWDAETGKEQRTLETNGVDVFRVAVSADGWHLAISGLRKEKDKLIPDVRVLSAKNGNVLRIISWENPSMWASSVAFSHDGKTLAVGALTSADINDKGSEKVKGELQLIPLR
jgi:RNA polymerase sigma factor (sigma-70 family)